MSPFQRYHNSNSTKVIHSRVVGVSYDVAAGGDKNEPEACCVAQVSTPSSITYYIGSIVQEGNNFESGCTECSLMIRSLNSRLPPRKMPLIHHMEKYHVVFNFK
jgi:hypothetical protein